MRSHQVTALVRALSFVAASALAACSSGGSTPGGAPTIVATASPKPTSPLTLSITWPAHTQANSAHRRRAFVSPSTKSLTVAIDGVQALEEDNPVTTGGAVTKTYTFTASIGSHTFLVALYDATGGTGNLLARSTTMQTIQMSEANMLAITVDGELASIGVVPVPNPYLETGIAGATYTLVGPLAQRFVIEPLDADGNIIVSPGAIPPLTLTSPSSGIVTTAVTGSPNEYTLSGPAPITAVTLTAAGSDLDAKAVTATFTAQILAALYVTDPVAHRVAVLDDKGDALAMPANAFPDIADTRNCGPRGIAYVAPNATYAMPTLFLTRCVGNPSNGGPGNIGIYDLMGNEIVPATPMAPNMPQFITYDAKNADIIVTDVGNVAQDPSVEKYALDGTQIFSNAGDHPRMFEQANEADKIALDPSLANPNLMETDGSGYLELYGNDGTMISRTAAGSPLGITYDANTKYYYVTSYYSFSPIAAVGPERGTVLAFDATGTMQTTGTANVAAFMGLSNRPADIVFDPYNLVLYVADYAGNKIVTFKEDGTSSTQFAANVTSVVDPEGLALAP